MVKSRIDTRRSGRVSLSFFEQGRRETEARMGIRAASLHDSSRKLPDAAW